ncbi:MAG: DUF1566 domain-containing protein, partial [Candidatus Electrothrix sp. MAN1_4]|nr:DUF1566 domain-containing protein [Candidatus Electrothrix sp. MAN1_4]
FGVVVDASITLTLIPDLQIHFYDAASGRMILEPSLYAEAALHGQFKYHDINGDVLTDLDYWFPYLNAGVALDMRLYAGLHIMDYNIVSWPEDVSYTETDKFKVFHPITKEEGKLYSLPTLEAAADMNPSDPPDSRAILVNGTSTDYITPLFGWKLNPFQAWTEPKVVTDREHSITALDETLEQHWFVPKEAGDFTVRLGGYSKLGWFVRQVADDVVLNLPDADENGLPDYWEDRFTLSGVSADDDNDGLDNLTEFGHGTDPTKLDSDGGGVSDGQEILDGTDPLDGSDDKVLSVVTVAGGSIAEGDSGMKNLAFTLTLDDYYDTASVDYITQDDTATGGSDYVSTSGTVSFNGGSTSETVNVSILGDTDVEPDETFSLELSNPVNLELGNTSAVGTLTNDDVEVTQVSLNDTGITWSGNYASGNNTSCVSSTTPDGDNVVAAQDCSHGRDVTHNDDSDGHAGFSYTKLDSNGVPLANQNADYATTPWACVQDNVTGLIWEVKTDDDGLHDKDDTYNWYNTDPSTNGGWDGYADDDGNICYGYNSGDSATFCNTEAYVNRVNAAGWCGASDWRMPTRKELKSIVAYDRYSPAIDTDYFSNAVSSYVWSGSPNADYSGSAWYVSFGNGNSNYVARYNSNAVRLVRGGQ